MLLIRKPVLCNYYVTYRCNASCSFCDIWEKPSPYISLENVEKNLKDLKKLGVKVLDFTGGEALLHQKIDQILQIAKDLGFITTLTTNGLLYPKFAKKIKGKVDMLHFSLDFADAEKHNESRGVKCFDFVMQSIEIAKKLGEKPDILMTVFKENLEEIEKIYYQITQKNDLILILNPAFEYNAIETGENFTKDELQFLRKWGKKKGIYLNDAFLELRKNGGNHTENPICKAGSSTIVISPENKLVLPCYHLGLEEIEIEDNLFALYHSEKVQNLIALEGRHSKCEGCVINCYMQPSFSVNINAYFWYALPSTLKYNLMKGTWKKLFKI